MDPHEAFKKEIEKLMPLFNSDKAKPKPKPGMLANVLSWLLLTVVACGTSLVVGMLVGFAVVGYRWITHLL